MQAKEAVGTILFSYLNTPWEETQHVKDANRPVATPEMLGLILVKELSDFLDYTELGRDLQEVLAKHLQPA